MASGVYNVGKGYFLEQEGTNANSDLWLLLTTGTPTFDQDRTTVTQVTTTDSNTELVQTGYTANGVRLSIGGTEGAHTLTVEVDQTDNNAEVRDDNDITWSSVASGSTITGALLYQAATPATPSHGSDVPLIFFDLPSDISTNGSDIVFNWGLDDTYKIVIQVA